jgi:hypothetical protein
MVHAGVLAAVLTVLVAADRVSAQSSVSSPASLAEAIASGVEHILITDHLDLSALADGSVSAGNASTASTLPLRIRPSTKTIRVRP